MTHTPISCAMLGMFCMLVASCAGPTPGSAVSPVSIGRYGHTLHDRFYEAWHQPASVAIPPGKVSVPVDVTIDSTGRVLDFRIVKPSGNARIDSSIAAVGKTVIHVAPPPATAARKPFKLRIYFELDIASSRGG